MDLLVAVGPPEQALRDDWRERSRRVRLLRQVPLFRGLSCEVLSSVAAALQPLSLGTGETVYREGEAADRLFVFESGRLCISTGAGQPKCPERELRPRQSLGHATLWDQGHYSETVRATEPTRLLTLFRSAVCQLRAAQPTVDQAFVAAVRLGQGALGSTTASERVRGLRIDAYGLNQVVKGGKRVLQDMSLSILPGELVAIVGGSGAGKTTLPRPGLRRSRLQ